MAIVWWNISKEFTINTKAKWYEHEPEQCQKKMALQILWHMPIQTDLACRLGEIAECSLGRAGRAIINN